MRITSVSNSGGISKLHLNRALLTAINTTTSISTTLNHRQSIQQPPRNVGFRPHPSTSLDQHRPNAFEDYATTAVVHLLSVQSTEFQYSVLDAISQISLLLGQGATIFTKQ